MRIIKLLVILLFAFFLTGCAYDRGIILFNSVPITQNNALHDQKVFKEGSKIYYLFIAPKKMENDFIRVQVFTMTDKSNLGGYEVVRTKDFRLMRDERYYYTDYFTFWEKGKYVMQVFSHDDFKNPLAVNYFIIN
jgi:hypothetical protein